MDEKTGVFLDASVLIAGLHSNKGGSAKILKLIKKKEIAGFISPSIIEKTKRIFKTKQGVKILWPYMIKIQPSPLN